MAGSSKHKSKAKPKYKRPLAATTATPDGFVEDIANAAGWNAVVATLCVLLDLPPLNTRSGLKKIHKAFSQIHKRLDDAYTRHFEDDRVVGGIVGIYAKMCADALLRDRLFKENLLSKLLPLLDRPLCCHVALQALCTVTHHGGRDVRLEIAMKTSTLVRLLQEQPNDAKIAELCVAVFAHAAGTVVMNEDPPDAKRKKALDVPSLLRVLLENVKKPTASRLLLDHAMEFLAGGSQHCASEYKACPSAINWLVACLRSPDIQTRCAALQGIMRLHYYDNEKEYFLHDPHKMVAAVQRGFPPHLSTVLMQHGPERVDTFLIMKTSADYQRAMMTAAQTKDLHVLGVTLAQLILRTEYSIADGMFQAEDPRTGRLDVIDVGLPFTRWLDALPLCAKVIRDKGIPAQEDLADILELKWLIMKPRMKEAHAIAKRAIQRSPHVGFFYYVLTLGADKADGLRIAKKGLKCKNMTDYVRYGLMFRAAEHAGSMGLEVLHEAMTGGRSWDEGIAFLTSAWEDAKAFVDGASPDTRNMKNGLYWYTLLTLVMKGPEISPDLRELQDAIDKLRIADELTIFLDKPIPKTQLWLARDTVVKRMPAAWAEWGTTVARSREALSDRVAASVVSPEKAEDDLAAWLDELYIDEEGDGHSHTHSGGCVPNPAVNPNNVKLYRCSWCQNPSAALRKCSGCTKTRYCDSACQKLHWSEGHRNSCKAS